jgi:hypothetical protein
MRAAIEGTVLIALITSRRLFCSFGIGAHAARINLSQNPMFVLTKNNRYIVHITRRRRDRQVQEKLSKTDSVTLVEYHPREWVDCSSPAYQRGLPARFFKSHPRQWVDRSSPAYKEDCPRASSNTTDGSGGLFKSRLVGPDRIPFLLPRAKRKITRTKATDPSFVVGRT